MTVRVTPVGTTGDVFAVSLRPRALWRLLLRAEERDFFAVRRRAHAGGYVWVDDKTRRPIASPRILAALDRCSTRRVPFRTIP